MRIGSLCSGIGGLELGLERAGLGETVWQAEIDPAANTVLARHWDVPIYEDVTDTDWTTVEPVDVICAGYPCQPFSHAGKREGTDDERHLWPAVRDAIRDLGPRLVVLENVRGHLSLGFGDVLGDLADLGFDAEWCLLRASDVGAPHQRARLFVVAYTDRRDWPEPDVRPTTGQPAPRRGDPRGRFWGPYAAAVDRWERVTRPSPAPAIDGRLSARFVEWMMGFEAGWTAGLSEAAAKRCLGNAVVPQVAERFGHMIAGQTSDDLESPAVLLPTPTSNQPGGTFEKHLARKNKNGTNRTRVTDLGMVVEQVLR